MFLCLLALDCLIIVLVTLSLCPLHTVVHYIYNVHCVPSHLILRPTFIFTSALPSISHYQSNQSAQQHSHRFQTDITMGKAVEVRWTCCNELISREEKESVASKIFRRSGKASKKEPIIVYQNGRCPDCTSRALKLAEEGKRARDEAEAQRYARAEDLQRMASTTVNHMEWKRLAGPAAADFSFEEEEPKRTLSIKSWVSEKR